MKRREFLAALGLAGGSLFLPSLRRQLLGSASATTTDAPPQRLIVFYTRHGVFGDSWAMNPLGESAAHQWSTPLASRTAEEFSPILSPLHPFRHSLSLVEGLSLLSAEADITGQRHELGQVHSLTGNRVELVGGVPLGSSISLDQAIAEEIARADRFRSLELAVGNPENSISYRGRLQVAPFESNPATIFKRLFGGGASANEALGGAQGSLLDAVAGRYDALSARLGADDRQKLETHRELVRELELRVEGLSDLQCDHGINEPTGLESYNDSFEAIASMITAALSCDLTRVITLNVDEIPLDHIKPGHGGSLHFDFAHDAYVNPEAAEVMTEFGLRHAQQLARLLELLDAVPEAGGSLLDNTLVAWVTELGDPAHGYDRYSAVLAGGAGLRHGSYHHHPSILPYEAWSWDGGITEVGPPHQRLLTTICRAMGLDRDSFGQQQVTGDDGEAIDLTGALEELL